MNFQKVNMDDEKPPKETNLKKLLGNIKENPFDYFFVFMLLVIIGIVIYPRVSLGEWDPRTGFGSYIIENEKILRGKTLWDWMELLIIPFVLAIVAILFNRAERDKEQKIAGDRAKLEQEISRDHQREDALQSYFDRITELLLRKDGGLKNSKLDDEIRVVARTRTLSTLRVLNPTRKRLLLQFIYEAKLISDKDVKITLEGADLSKANLAFTRLDNICLVKTNLEGADLMGAELNKANLEGSNLIDANLSRTNLRDANLREADLGRAELRKAYLRGVNLREASLWRANLSEANLREADLKKTYLKGADLTKANMRSANLTGANLAWANLTGANLTGADLTGACLFNVILISSNLTNATMPNGKKYDPEIHSIEKLTGKQGV